MSTAGSRPWIAGGVLAALVLAAVTWFLVVGPTRSDARTLRDDTAAVQQQNAALQAKADVLRAQAENRGELESGVRDALSALPSDVALPDFNRELAQHAAARGVALTSISVGAAAAPGVAGVAGETAAPAGLLGVPITIQTTGPALNQLFFLRDVQEVGPRAALVSAASMAALENADTDASATLTTQLTVFASTLSARDAELLAGVLGNLPTAG